MPSLLSLIKGMVTKINNQCRDRGHTNKKSLLPKKEALKGQEGLTVGESLLL